MPRWRSKIREYWVTFKKTAEWPRKKRVYFSLSGLMPRIHSIGTWKNETVSFYPHLDNSKSSKRLEKSFVASHRKNRRKMNLWNRKFWYNPLIFLRKVPIILLCLKIIVRRENFVDSETERRQRTEAQERFHVKFGQSLLWRRKRKKGKDSFFFEFDTDKKTM